MTLPSSIERRLRIPLVSAPMHRFSGFRLASAACSAGIVGAFPSSNARSIDELDGWLDRFELVDRECVEQGRPRPAPHCPNLIMPQPRLAEDIASITRHRVEMVITSVGSPAPVIRPLHDIGCMVFSDVATIGHAEKALAAGADGLVLLSAGAGGQTGWLNPFAFVRAVRQFFDGPVVLSGGISDGIALQAARILGCDLAYMGTGFIATRQSEASDAYREALVAATADDVMLTSAFTGLPTSMLRSSIVAAGLDPSRLPEEITVTTASTLYGASGAEGAPRRWTEIFSAGHSVSGVQRIRSVEELVDEVADAYFGAGVSHSD
jgi:nitronate monooxygenase